MSEEEKAEAQVGDQGRHDDRGQKSTLRQELGTGYRQQEGEALQGCPTGSDYRG